MGYLTSVVARRLAALLGKGFAAAGLDLSAEQWGLMVMLWERDGQAQWELAQGLDLEKSSVSRILDGMERRGVVHRTPDLQDGRSKLVRLTPKGLALRQPCAQVAQTALAQAQRGIRPAELELCRDVLRRVHANLAGDEPPGQPL